MKISIVTVKEEKFELCCIDIHYTDHIPSGRHRLCVEAGDDFGFEFK